MIFSSTIQGLEDLLLLLTAGHTDAQIVRRLGICEGTVRSYLENIYDQQGVSSRTAAVTRAFPHGVAVMSTFPSGSPAAQTCEKRTLATRYHHRNRLSQPRLSPPPVSICPQLGHPRAQSGLWPTTGATPGSDPG